MSKELVWRKEEAIPAGIDQVSDIVKFGNQLSEKDKRQIVSGFESGNYEMVSTFVWSKAMFVLKSTLASMGKEFLAEMLDRPDIDDSTNIHQVVSEYEAIRLAEELGIVSGTSIMRLKNAMNLVSHFISTDGIEDGDKEMDREEAAMIIKPCFRSILAYEKVEAAIDFKNFRASLEERTLTLSEPYINKLVSAPFFFKRTTVRLILSLIKTTSGAQLENALANANLIIPLIWSEIKAPEKWQIGRVYAELNADGKTKAVSGLRQVLLKVRGFDFVPEDLRSNSFIKVASEILVVHNSFDNFYHEPAPVTTLANMGSVIPIPAFPKCMTALLSVKLGNHYGVSKAAQAPADRMLNNVTEDRWIYYLVDCLSNDEDILNKLTSERLALKWTTLINSHIDVEAAIPRSTEKNLLGLVRATKNKSPEKVAFFANAMRSGLGYSR